MALQLPSDFVLGQLRPDGRAVAFANGHSYLVEEPTLSLLRTVESKGSVDLGTLAEVLGIAEEGGRRSELQAFIDDVLLKEGLLIDTEAPSKGAASFVDPLALGVKVRLLDEVRMMRLAQLIAPIASQRSVLVLFVVALTASVLAVFEAWQAGLLTDGLRILGAVAVVAPGITLLALLSLVIHEIGHAAAAFHEGGRVDGAGVGIYFGSMVAYVGLDSVHRLRRRSRLSVDCAGIAFQGLCLVPVVVAATIWPSDYLMVIAFSLSTSILANLSPLTRLDGYWIICDLFEAQQLHAKALLFVRPKRGWRTLPTSERWAALTLIGSFLMYIATGAILVALIGFLIPMSFPRFVQNEVAQLFSAVSSGALEAVIGSAWRLLFGAVMPAVGWGFALIQTGKLLYRRIPLTRSIEGRGASPHVQRT